LWRDFAPDLRRFLRRQVRDDALADDLLQDVFLRVHLHLARLRAPERVAPWLYRIARNLVIDHARRQAVRDNLAAEPEARDDGPEPSPETQLAAWMMREVARFPAPYREALTRVDADGQCTADVARALGLSTPGVKSRVQRARRRLAQATDRCCAVELDRHGRVVDIRRRRPAPPARCCEAS
jgi:RNA polymerase sigma-70 factor (ECF subfamily)